MWQGDVVNPDRVHMVAAGIESITIGNTSYLKQKGVWQKVVADPHSGNPSNVLARYRADSHSTDLGTRMVDGVALHAYRIDHAKTHRMEMIFVDNADRIVRIESGATVMRMSNYNEAVTISPPM